jgi:serine/threonine protein kinase
MSDLMPPPPPPAEPTADAVGPTPVAPVGAGAGAGGALESSPRPFPLTPMLAFDAARSRKSFQMLVQEAGLTFDREVAHRAYLKYSANVTLATFEQSAELAASVYSMGRDLPGPDTTRDLKTNGGYTLAHLATPMSTLVIGSKNERVYVFRCLKSDELIRAQGLLDAFVGRPIPHAAPFEIVPAGSRHVMVTPKFATDLSALPPLSPAGVKLVWAQMKEALEALHAKGLGHSDVKPANICVSECGRSFYLIDLAGVARFGFFSSTTRAYAPKGSGFGISSAKLDWWCLAMTLVDKGCGGNSISCADERFPKTTGEAEEHLAAHLDPEVWADLKSKLGIV